MLGGTDNIMWNVLSFEHNVRSIPHNIVGPQNIIMDLNNVMLCCISKFMIKTFLKMGLKIEI